MPTGINLDPRSPLITQEALRFVALTDYTTFPQITSYQQNGANIFDKTATLTYVVNQPTLSTVSVSVTVNPTVSSVIYTGSPVFFSLTGKGLGTFTTMSAAACKNVDVYNNSISSVYIDRGAAPMFILPIGSNKTFHVISNSNELRYSSITASPISVEAWG